MMKLISLALMTLMLVGCSTTPVDFTTATNVPEERVYDTTMVSQDAERNTSITFLRDARYLGSGCSHEVFIDNNKLFAIRAGEMIKVFIKEGEHFIRLETGHGLCPNISISQDVRMIKGADQEYRILLPSDGSLRLSRIK
jgi:hypothetical protein